MVTAQEIERLTSSPTALMEAFFALCRDEYTRVQESSCVQAAGRGYLVGRGFDAEELSHLPLGLFGEAAEVDDRLQGLGFTRATIDQSHLLADSRLPGRIVGPIRHPDGRLISFWAQHPLGQQPGQLYLRRSWREEVPLIGLETAVPACRQRGRSLLIVEDIFEGLLLAVRGFETVAAIDGSGSELDSRGWERLAALGIERVILALAHPGQDGCEVLTAIAAARRARVAPEIRVFAWELLSELLRPREWFYRLGAEPFRLFVEREAVAADRYRRTTPAPQPEPPLPAVPSSPAAAAPQPIRPRRLAGRRRGEDCPLHHGRETDCFCFD